MKLCASCQNKYPDDANFCPREECATPEGPHRLILLAADGTTDASSTESPPAAGAPAPGKAAPPARFVLVSRIGGGPSGEVWQASDAQTGAAVAYKAVAPGSLPTQIMMDRAMRELRQLQRTSSPRIVKVVDFGKTDDGAMYVASELASGEPLDQIVARSGPFPLDRAKRIVAQVGEALLDAQKVGVVHRDLSAKNVLVAGDDEVRIINFAIARPFSETVCGVPEFMSPEQADGKLIDQRSNTYSLGALIYYMLTGQAPFVGASPQATIEAIHKGELVPPSIKRSGVGLTAEVDRVVLKALERSSSRRPLTLRQFLADVAALVVSEQTATTISTPSGKEPTFVKTMMFAGGSQEVQKLVAQAVAARDAAAGGSPAGPGAVIPNPTTVGMGPPPPRLPTPVPLTGGRPTGAGLPSGTPGPAPKEGAPRPSHGAAVAQTMIAMPAATGVPVPGSSGAGAGGGVASTATEGAPGSTTAGAPEAAGGNSAAAGAAAPGSVNFRETLWFKRGDVDQMVADARAKMQAMAEAKGEGKKPSGEVGPDSGATAAAASAAAAAETKPLEDRYVDDGTLTADDRKNFSLRRGSGPNATMNARAGDIPGERMSETEVIDEIGGRKRIKIFGIVAAVTAALVVVIVVMARGKGKGDGQKPAAAATTAGAPVAPPPPPVAPPPPAPARGDQGTAKEAEGTGGGSKPATAARRKAPAKKKQASPAPAKTSSTTSKKKKEPTK